MKRFLVFTLVLTLIFPAYCFSAPSGVPVCEKYDKLIEEFIDAMKCIIEDGKVDEEEMTDLAHDLQYCLFVDNLIYIIYLLFLWEVAQDPTGLTILLIVFWYIVALVSG